MVKLIFIFLVLAPFSINGANTTNSKIENYIELMAKLSRDTVSFDSIVKIIVIYNNKTGKPISLYPKALLSLVRPLGGFEFDSYFLNKATDLTQCIILEPFGNHKETYTIKIEPPFFRKGLNTLYLYYLFKQQKGSFRKNNYLFGGLQSNELIIFIY